MTPSARRKTSRSANSGKFAAWLGLCAVVLVAAFILLRKTNVDPGSWWFSDDGYKLLRGGGATPLTGWRMPSPSLLDALSDWLSPARGHGALSMLGLFSCATLVFALGAGLYSLWGGIFALALSVLYLRFASDGLELEGLLYCAVSLSFAAFWTMELKPRIKGWLCGLSLAASLFVRSPLFLFPFFMVAYDWCCGEWPVEKAREFARNWAPLFCVPAAALFFWALVQWRANGAFSVFEHGRSASNLITGALGLVATIEGDPYKLADLSGSRSIFWWALHTIVTNPVRYAEAFFARLYFVFHLHPWLFSAAALGLWRMRASANFRRLGLLAGYYIGIHCLLAVEPRYFIFLWLLLCALACGLLDFLPFGLSFPKAERAGLYAAVTAWLPQLALFCLTLFFVVLYPLRMKTASAWAASFTGPVLDAWNCRELGKYYSDAGDNEKASVYFASAWQLRKETANAFDYALSLYAAGKLDGVEFGGMPAADYLAQNAGWEGLVFKGIVALENGVLADARDSMLHAHDQWAAGSCMFRRAETPYEKELQDKLRASDPNFTRAIMNVLVKLPYARRLRITRLLPKIGIPAEPFMRDMEEQPAIASRNEVKATAKPVYRHRRARRRRH
jgi:hypothetical protein